MKCTDGLGSVLALLQGFLATWRFAPYSLRLSARPRCQESGSASSRAEPAPCADAELFHIYQGFVSPHCSTSMTRRARRPGYAQDTHHQQKWPHLSRHVQAEVQNGQSTSFSSRRRPCGASACKSAALPELQAKAKKQPNTLRRRSQVHPHLRTTFRAAGLPTP